MSRKSPLKRVKLIRNQDEIEADLAIVNGKSSTTRTYLERIQALERVAKDVQQLLHANAELAEEARQAMDRYTNLRKTVVPLLEAVKSTAEAASIDAVLPVPEITREQIANAFDVPLNFRGDTITSSRTIFSPDDKEGIAREMAVRGDVIIGMVDR